MNLYGITYKLPSGAIIQVGTRVSNTVDDWNCTYRSFNDSPSITLSGEFIRKYGKAW